MTKSTASALVIILALALSAVYAALTDASERRPSRTHEAQTPTRSEKETRTAAQQKINSQLLYEIYRRRGVAAQKRIPPGKTDVRIDARGRALVDVRAVPVTRALQKQIQTLGGTVLSVTAEQHSILAWIPLLKLEGLAEDKTVRFIEPAAEATTEHPPTGGDK
jgi:hypothetical protein